MALRCEVAQAGDGTEGSTWGETLSLKARSSRSDSRRDGAGFHYPRRGKYRPLPSSLVVTSIMAVWKDEASSSDVLHSLSGYCFRH
jgi:hypothetical protein